MFELNLHTLILTCLLIILCNFVYYTFKIYLTRRKYRNIPGPRTNGILEFYMGNIFQKKEERFLAPKCSKWIEEYGNTIKFQILDKIVVNTVDLQAIKEILVDENFSKEPILYSNFGYPYGARYLGQGLVTDMNSIRWKHRRALFNPAFHKHVLNSFIDEFNAKGDILLDKFRSFADFSEPINMLDNFNNATLDAIATIAFGMECNTLNDPTNKLNKYVTESIKGFFQYHLSRVKNFNLVNLMCDWRYKSEYVKLIENLRKIGRDQIESRLKLLRDGDYVPQDLLTITLKSYENETFQMEDMVDDFITFFIAGQETTANTLAFCFLELAQNPNVFQRLREEIDSVFGSRETINQQDLFELKYTNCVIKETLRKWPVVPDLNRIITSNDFHIKSFHIPKGTQIQVSPFACSRVEEYFPNHTQFQPERFLNENEIKTYSYFPFSMGPRNCIGQNFAQIEMKILIVKLVKHFNFELVPNQDFSPVLHATLRPNSGPLMFIKARKL